MKKWFLVILLFHQNCFCQLTNYNQRDSLGRKQGLWTKYHDDSIHLKIIGNYIDNKPSGTFMKFYENGNIKEKGTFINNRCVDTLERFFKNGEAEYIGIYTKTGKKTLEQYPNKFEFHFDSLENFSPTKRILLDSAYLIEFQRMYTICGIPQLFNKTALDENERTLSIPLLASTFKEECVPKDKLPYGVIIKTACFTRNGYNKVYNLQGEILQDGQFKDGSLYQGKIYLYDSDGILLSVKIYVDGKLYSYGIL